MIAGILLIMVFQFAGQVTVTSLQLMFPGSLCGLLYLLVWLLWTGEPSKAIDDTASLLLANFGLMFVPAGVAIIVFSDVLRDSWFAILAALLASTLVSITVVGLIADTAMAASVAEFKTPEAAE
jgi:putative effector of murein hydrolase LrgA (UPF0299 family)